MSTTSITPTSAEGALVATASAKARSKAAAAAPAAEPAAAAAAFLERGVTESAGFAPWDGVVGAGVAAAPPTPGDRCSRLRISERRMARRPLWKEGVSRSRDSAGGGQKEMINHSLFALGGSSRFRAGKRKKPQDFDKDFEENVWQHYGCVDTGLPKTEYPPRWGEATPPTANLSHVEQTKRERRLTGKPSENWDGKAPKSRAEGIKQDNSARRRSRQRRKNVRQPD